jgi:hypothetical protein
MGILNLVALGFGLIFLTIVFGTILICRKMRRSAREKTHPWDPVPWQPDLSQGYVAQLPPAQLPPAQLPSAQLLPPYVGVTQQRHVMDTEQGYIWTR